MPKTVFTREDVVAAGLAVVAREGLAQLSARRVAEEMGSSTAPVYSNFANMNELSDAVKRAGVAELLAASRVRRTDDEFRNMGLGILGYVWAKPAVYAALFLEQSAGYDPGPDFLESIANAAVELPSLAMLPVAERLIVLKKLALFTHGLATEICQGCAEHCTLESMETIMSEVGNAVMAHACAGVNRDPETTKLLAWFWDDRTGSGE
ncbi:MAG: TetR family transcriptional regulator [bacterium]|nr:TetR family transcriptional regulator [bacterium]